MASLNIFIIMWVQAAVLLVTIKLGYGEFRFCFKGPQRMSDDDCPGGFVFNEKTRPTCKFYGKTGNHTGRVLSVPADVCDDNSVRAIENGGDDMADIESLTWLSWEEFAANETLGTFPEENGCLSECLPDWENENAVADEDPFPDNWDPSTVKDRLKGLQTLNKDLFFLILTGDDNEKDPRQSDLPKALNMAPLPPAPANAPADEPLTNIQRAENNLIIKTPKESSELYIMKLLARTFKVVSSVCSPFVPEDFLEQVLKGMISITQHYVRFINDVGMDIYEGISRILQHCGLKHQQQRFILNGTKCIGKEKVNGIYYPIKKVYWPYRLTGRSFRWGKYHPIVDATWTSIEIIYSYCFDSFTTDMLLSHVYHLSMGELFTNEVQTFWRANPPLKNEQFWNNVLQTYDLNVTMRNLDACVVGARKTSPINATLPRRFLGWDDIKQPDPEPKPAEPEKGWPGTIDKYWQHYEKQGGFKKVSEKFGKCFQEPNSDQYNDMVDNLKKTCS